MALLDNFKQHFSAIEDPRVSNHNKRHELTDILILTILAVICGADGWVGVESFGRGKLAWLKTFLVLPNGIPSHDVIGNVFSRINSEQLRHCFLSWIKSLELNTSGELIAIDGKTLRHSYDTKQGLRAIHMVSAWAVKNRLVLGQIKTAEKSNEITAIPELLKILDIKNSTVTIDAMGCQKNIAQDIIQGDGDYVLALKGNHEKLHKDVALFFEEACKNNFTEVAHEYMETKDEDKGRIEIRRYWVTEKVDSLSGKQDWENLTTIGMVESERHIKGKVSIEKRYYISSLKSDVKKFSYAARGHWGIENNLHWTLDVSFNEDQCRIRKDNAPENLAVLRHIAVNLLGGEKSVKLGIRNKRLRAGWAENYLIKILQSGQL